jgi:hypothetical protein
MEGEMGVRSVERGGYRIWIIGYTKVTHGQFLKTALPWAWAMTAIIAFLAYSMVPWP